MRNVWLWIGAAISLVYVCAASYFGLLFDNFLARFTTLTLNEQGDTVAGVFAPLAFLWLFIATMIQSQELAAQREELRQNREVSKEQTKAAEDQAKFLSAQTQAMEAQTKLLTEQTEIAKLTAQRNHQLSMFDRRIDTYTTIIAMRKKTAHGNWFLHSEPLMLYEMSNKAVFLFGKEVVEWLAELASEIETSLAYITRIQQLTALTGEQTPDDTRDASGMTYKEMREKLNATNEWIRDQFTPSVVNDMFEPYLNIMDGGPVVTVAKFDYGINGSTS